MAVAIAMAAPVESLVIAGNPPPSTDPCASSGETEQDLCRLEDGSGQELANRRAQLLAARNETRDATITALARANAFAWEGIVIPSDDAGWSALVHANNAAFAFLDEEDERAWSEADAAAADAARFGGDIDALIWEFTSRAANLTWEEAINVSDAAWADVWETWWEERQPADVLRDLMLHFTHVNPGPVGTSTSSTSASGGAAPTGPDERPVLLIVHGRTTMDMTSWEDLAELLALSGEYRSVERVGYYGGECGIDVQTAGSGDHGAFYPESPMTYRDEHGRVYTSPGGHESIQADCGVRVHYTMSDVRHLAYHFAWEIYHDYTERGVPVKIVAHSLGGLIVRYALYKVEMGNDVFPRGLLVEDVVTVGAPHHQPENAEGELCAGAPFADVQQVCGLTGMMRVLRYLGQSPQGASGTDWTVAASLCDDYLPDSFWWQYGRFAAWFYTGWRPELWDDMINMTGAHKVLYVSPCYYHDQYYQSDFEPEPGYPGGRVLVNDADVWFGSGSGWVHEAGTAGRFPIWTWNALASPSW